MSDAVQKLRVSDVRRFKPYPAYKPSGVEWLGDVPEHWNVKRLKTSAKYWVSNVDKVPLEDETPIRLCNYTDVYYNERIRPDMGLMETTATKEEIEHFGLRVGDVLITKDSEEWNDIAVPALVASTAPDLVCGYHLAIIRPTQRKLLGVFLLRALQSCAINQQFQIAATGVTRYGLPKSAIGEALLPLPPTNEQSDIAAFLECETAKIDALIAKKRTLIERLKENRSALISRTVTHGIPFDVARAAGLPKIPTLKPSGLEELPEIPSDWKVSRVWLERVAGNIEYQDGNHGELHPKAEDYVSDGIPFIMANHIVAGRIDFGICNYIEPELAATLRIGFARTGDVLLTHKGTIGRVGVIQENRFPYIVLTPQVTYYRCLRHISGRYLFWFFQGRYWQDQMHLVSSLGTTRGYVGLLDQRSLKLILPTPPEQVAIASYLDVETAKLDASAARIEAASDRLQEYRTA